MYWILLLQVVLLVNTSTACTTPTFSNLTVQSNFSLHNFLGIWYEIKAYLNETNTGLDVWHDFSQSFQLETNSSERLLVYGKARLTQEDQCFSFGPWLLIANDSAKMIQVEKDELTYTTNLYWPYYILKTDYNHYALIYRCKTKNYRLNDPCDDPTVWVFSRTRSLSYEYTKELDTYIENILCMNVTTFEIISHREQSCYMNSVLNLKFYSMNIILCLILLVFV
ncbi:unnamed protein product [Adineta steineri]|uniref:Lipocalin/cytosolic fatty-acid binding domain-containing protein n=1 Tax=Adineta steineri TaxID=433720 RepID=A0A819DF44_9BILA|nr:unnamed protein product [Adineta steineri]CAF3836199.1 unnamed protein product [Adineta steineri]